ncbi:MAG: site-specific integrase, partial [Planctomycetota bacterium]
MIEPAPRLRHEDRPPAEPAPALRLAGTEDDTAPATDAATPDTSATPDAAPEGRLIDRFADYLKHERHFSPYTARCYGADLRQYVEYLESTTSPDGFADIAAAVEAKMQRADAMVVRGFLAFLDQFGYSPATTARKIATLRSFYKWMLKHGLADSNPMLLIRTPKQAKR